MSGLGPRFSVRAKVAAALLALSAASAGQAQAQRAAEPVVGIVALPPAPPYVDLLPGYGRPVDIQATTARRRRLAEAIGDAVVLIPAARERDIEGVDYPQDNDFRQHNVFFYFTMLETARAWMVMNTRAGGEAEAVLLLPPRNPQRERWTGVRLGPGDEAVRLSGFPAVLPVAALDSVVRAAVARGVPIYAPLDHTTGADTLIRSLRSRTDLVVRDLVPLVNRMRMVKDSAELVALRRAVTISANAHVELMRQAREGMFEYELEAIFEGSLRRQGADRVGYPSIVGSGLNATTLHYDVNRRQTRAGDLVVVDAAGEWGQHTADITRTFPISGRFTDRQRALYNLVLGAQQAAIDSTRPGITLGRLNQIARAWLRDNSRGLCGERTCDWYMIHGLAHGIGMDVHDPLPGNVPLEPGMVFTIEPGVYLPAESLGIRIEDDILVTRTGHEVLSANAPRSAEDIERLMAEGRRSAAAEPVRRRRD